MKEKLMVKKTKVIAFRVNADEYEQLALLAKLAKQSLSEYVCKEIKESRGMDLLWAKDHLAKERKKAEAKAKRLAKKEAAL
jgi:uncharacterized protein (DUF1778 family)